VGAGAKRARQHRRSRRRPRAPAAEKLVQTGEQRLLQLGARRVTALVAYDDPDAAAFWDSAGYPIDPDIGRRVRNL
jgi:hypothetical protein